MADTEFTSFKDVDWRRQEEEDELALQSLLNQTQQPGGEQTALLDVSRPLDAGEKADDAQDFEDISDDDLPEEEDATGDKVDDAPGLTDDMGMAFDEDDDDDDLFGDGGRASSPLPEDQDTFQPNGVTLPTRVNGGLTLPSLEPEVEVDLRELNFPESDDPVNQDSSMPSGQEELDEYLAQHWSGFEKGGVLDWNQLMPPKEAYFIPKVPLKNPKPVNPTKVSLDLATDQEKSFRTAGPANTEKHKRVAEAEAKGLVAIVDESENEGDSDDEFDYTPIDPMEKVGGVTMIDLEIICADFESAINSEVPQTQIEEVEDEPMDEWEKEILGHSSKKRKAQAEPEFVMAPNYPMPNFDNFEQMTAQTAKRVVLDLNDPYLLVDIQEYDPTAKRRRITGPGTLKRTGNGSFASTLTQRFNISNDEAYDALKENHQSKVRATLGNLSVEHSMPALKLQWPYYRVKLYTREARSFHRPALKFNKFLNQPILFTKPGMRKKKSVKNMPTHEVFKETKDLSLADHYSSATLLEYCEEHPTVLSNFGMGNRIINYYRRKDAEDTERPQPEDKIGDVTVLLPEDRSPFANFGMVDPGETVRTIHNGMYRAPIFKHDPKTTDFLVIRNSTGVSGTSWHIRNIDNLFVVGQQLPSMEIPGPHSRKVTNAAKNRMKMIAFRKIRHSPQQHLKIGEITSHIFESSDMQNRQKLKEFMHYDKVEKVWRMKPGDTIPEESTIRQMVKPEEVCVIDAMQVGARHLEDAGYAAEEDDDQIDEEGQSLEQNLAPWKTSKAFLEASADKAMLQLHGAGDPTGCGLGMSFVKTSMKGGYLEGIQDTPISTTAARVALDRKANNGHGYNVKTQQNLYNDAIHRIWVGQKNDLSDASQREDMDMDRDIAEDDSHGVAQTPHSMATPAAFDDNASVFSTNTQQGKVMRITRKIVNEFGQVSEVSEIVKDPKVWHQYEKRRRELDAEAMNVYEIKPTGNPELDRQEAFRVRKELLRLERNRERRHAREKSKKGGVSKRRSKEPDNMLSPSSTPAPSVEKPTGTTRKCANCGMAGHIKTNKKLCPMLNGTMKQEDIAPNHGGFGAIQAPSFS